MLNSLCTYLSGLHRQIKETDIKTYIEKNYPNFVVYFASSQRPFDCRICDTTDTIITEIPTGTHNKPEYYKGLKYLIELKGTTGNNNIILNDTPICGYCNRIPVYYIIQNNLKPKKLKYKPLPISNIFLLNASNYDNVNYEDIVLKIGIWRAENSTQSWCKTPSVCPRKNFAISYKALKNFLIKF